MGLLAPQPTPYDPLQWRALPFAERARAVCRAWALQGYGTPIAVQALYAIKIGFLIALWFLACWSSPSLGAPWEVASFWSHPLAFQKAIVLNVVFELLGLGCGSGPLTGRYYPPVGGFLYFLRPGTTKMPLFPGKPWIGGRTRGLFEVALYAVTVIVLVWVLFGAGFDSRLVLLVVVALPVLGVFDKTIFLAARSEHYWTTLLLFLLSPAWIGAAKWVQAALWFWAGVSKLNPHFSRVVCVMISNSPLIRWKWIRRAMYRDYPRDLNPSRIASVMGHLGTALELSIPILLMVGRGGPLTWVGLAMMVLLHVFITSSVPMGVPLEWNVLVVYGGFFLFGAHATESPFSVGWMSAVLLAAIGLVLPLLGNLYPQWISFLFSMRYYAGNWAHSVWLFRGASYKRLERLTKSSGWIYDQLGRMYDDATCVGVFGKVIAFRLMHLHGRGLLKTVPRAVDRIEDYEWVDGEIVAGLALGWNFGDGHLHNEQLLRSIQAQCAFEEGELRCVFVESQPLGRQEMNYRIHDAAKGLLEEGELSVPELERLQPFPEVKSA